VIDWVINWVMDRVVDWVMDRVGMIGRRKDEVEWSVRERQITDG
jgi:hypothetical protein